MSASPSSVVVGRKCIKLLLIGDSGVGKSSILLRFTQGEFHSSYVNTIGIDFKNRDVELDNELYRLQVWDTAGQERFRSVTAMYYRGAAGIVLVYDVTRRSSFDNVRHWVDKIDQYAPPNVVRLLVGNKIDLTEARAISTEEGKKLAEAHQMPFMETSALTGDRIVNAFLEMALECKQRGLITISKVHATREIAGGAGAGAGGGGGAGTAASLASGSASAGSSVGVPPASAVAGDGSSGSNSAGSSSAQLHANHDAALPMLRASSKPGSLMEQAPVPENTGSAAGERSAFESAAPLVDDGAPRGGRRATLRAASPPTNIVTLSTFDGHARRGAREQADTTTQVRRCCST